MIVTRYCVRLERKIPSKWLKCGCTQSQLTIDYYSAIPPQIMEGVSSRKVPSMWMKCGYTKSTVTRLEFYEPIEKEYPGWTVLNAEKVNV